MRPLPYRSSLRHVASARRARPVAGALALLAFFGADAQSHRSAEILDRALALTPDVRNGQVLYRDLCQSCHGVDATGDAEWVIPALAGQVDSYLIKQLVDFAEGDRVGPEMHRAVARKRLITPQSLRDVSGYLATLPPTGSPERGDGRQLAQGKRVYEGLCIQCHGAQGEGDRAAAVPSLQRQHYAYLIAQIRSLATGHRYAVELGVESALKRLSYDELTAVADYASRLPRAAVTTTESTPR
jgi:cytochrome c553